MRSTTPLTVSINVTRLRLLASFLLCVWERVGDDLRIVLVVNMYKTTFTVNATEIKEAEMIFIGT